MSACDHQHPRPGILFGRRLYLANGHPLGCAREGLAELKLKMSETHLALSQRQTTGERNLAAREHELGELREKLTMILKRFKDWWPE